MKTIVIHINETVEGAPVYFLKHGQLKKRANIWTNISQLMLDFINCRENAYRKLAIMFLTDVKAYDDPKICILIFGATLL